MICSYMAFPALNDTSLYFVEHSSCAALATSGKGDDTFSDNLLSVFSRVG